MKSMSIEYSVAATTVADDYEEDGVFRATPIAIEMKKVGHSLFGCCCDTRRGTIIVGFITIAASIIALAAEGFGLYALDTINSTPAALSAAPNTTFGKKDDAMASSGNFGLNDDLMTALNSTFAAFFGALNASFGEGNDAMAPFDGVNDDFMASMNSTFGALFGAFNTTFGQSDDAMAPFDGVNGDLMAMMNSTFGALFGAFNASFGGGDDAMTPFDGVNDDFMASMNSTFGALFGAFNTTFGQSDDAMAPFDGVNGDLMKMMNSTFDALFGAFNASFGQSDDAMTPTDSNNPVAPTDSNNLMASTRQQNTNNAKHAIANSMVFSLASLLLAIASIYGAMTFQTWPVAVNVIFLLAHSIFYFFSSGAYLAFVVAAFWMYPQIMFIVEVQKGLMSSKTYYHEAQSCCCITKASRKEKSMSIQECGMEVL